MPLVKWLLAVPHYIVLFFLTTNLANWASLGTYPLTPAGLLLCYVAGIPYFWNTLAAELAGTSVLFSVDALARRSPERRAVRTGACRNGN